MIRGERQKEAITKVLEAIINDNEADACFLKGSIARGEDDEYSDVDFYCLPKNIDSFLNKRITYLQSYKPILHVEEVSFACPQMICIYEDGLCFDLLTTTLDKLNNDDQIKVLYDPQNLLENYQTQFLKLKPQDVGNLINQFSFTILEYHQAFNRNDEIRALRLAHYLFGYYTKLIRYFVEPEKAKIGVKGFTKIIDYPNYQKYLEILKMLKYQSSLVAVQMMIAEVDNLVMQLPIKVAEFINMDFYLYSKNLSFI